MNANTVVDSERLRRFEDQVTADWQHLDTQTTPSGTRCVGHVTQVAPKAWLHRFYAPLTVTDLVQFTDRTSMPIPIDWQEMLLAFNGINLFVARIILGGVIPDGNDRHADLQRFLGRLTGRDHTGTTPRRVDYP